MHEAGLLAAAVTEALASGRAADTAVGLEITIHDPVHVGPDAAALHAELALRARGLGHLPIAVHADPVECALCGVSNDVVAGHPFCAACGMPLPDRGGHAVAARIWWRDEAIPEPLARAFARDSEPVPA
jgi:hypothetical protein